MPVNSIILTDKGFKVSSNDSILNWFSLIFLIVLFLVFGNFNSSKIITIALVFVSSVLFFTYYKFKIGTIYSVSYFFNILLYLLLIPDIFYSLPIFILTLLIYFALIFRGNFFAKFKLPVGLFLALLHTAIYLIGFRIFQYSFKILSFHSNLYSQINPQISGIFYPSYYLINSEYSLNSYSILENSGIYLTILVGLLLFKNKSFFLDIIFLILMSLSLFVYYTINFEFYLNQVINLVLIAYLLHISPGKLNMNTILIQIFSFLFLFLVQYAFILLHIIYSPFILLVVYFSFYGSMIYLITKFAFLKKLLIEFELKI